MYPYSRSRMKGMFKNVNWERDWEVLSRRSEGEVEVERSGKGERRFRLFKGAGRLSGSSGSSGKGVYDEERGGSVRKIVVSDETRVV